jgi:hypothetical protein
VEPPPSTGKTLARERRRWFLQGESRAHQGPKLARVLALAEDGCDFPIAVPSLLDDLRLNAIRALDHREFFLEHLIPPDRIATNALVDATIIRPDTICV